MEPDPLTSLTGSYPVSTGGGAVPGPGPIGSPIHSVIDAITNTPPTHEEINAEAEEAYWREHHRDLGFSSEENLFEDFAPAYRAGFLGFREDQTFADREADLRAAYETGQAGRLRPWDEVRAAARAAYERVSRGEANRYESKVSGTNSGNG